MFFNFVAFITYSQKNVGKKVHYFKIIHVEWITFDINISIKI